MVFVETDVASESCTAFSSTNGEMHGEAGGEATVGDEDKESDLSFLVIAGAGKRMVLIRDDGPEDRDLEAVFNVLSLLSPGPSNRQSIPCCFLSWARDSLRASRSSFDLAIFSGWW